MYNASMELPKSAREVITSQLFTVSVIVLTSIAFGIIFLVLVNVLQQEGKVTINEDEEETVETERPESQSPARTQYAFMLTETPANPTVTQVQQEGNKCQPVAFDPRATQITAKSQKFAIPEKYYEVLSGNDIFTFTKNGFEVEGSAKPVVISPLSADVYSFFCENGEISYVIEINRLNTRGVFLSRAVLLTQVVSYEFIDNSTLYVVQLVQNGQLWEKQAQIISLPGLQRKSIPISLACVGGSAMILNNELVLANKQTEGRPPEPGKYPTSLCFVTKEGVIRAMATTSLSWDGEDQKTPVFQLFSTPSQPGAIAIYDTFFTGQNAGCHLYVQSLSNGLEQKQFSLDKIALGSTQKHCPRIQFDASTLSFTSEALQYRVESYNQVLRQLQWSEWHSAGIIK